FTSCLEADVNLAREGIDAGRVHLVGNVMIDTLLRYRPRARRPAVMDALGLQRRRYGVVTLHRPVNVDHLEDALVALDAIEQVVDRMPILFPAPPRSRRPFEAPALARRLQGMPRLHLIEPLGYVEFLHLMDHAGVVLTDSGGIQEETTVLGVPC